MQSSIKSPYLSHNKERIVQGDIFKDFKYFSINAQGEVEEYTFAYCVLLTQDCDLENEQRTNLLNQGPTNPNSYLPNLLIAPAFLLDEVKAGTHLKSIFDITQRVIPTADLQKIKQNKDDRYHYIQFSPDVQVPELIIDFKHYFTVQLDFIKQNYSTLYLTTINELFRERLSQRFTSYLSRIGLPNF